MTAPPVKKAKLNCASKLRFNTAEQAIANMAFSAEKWGVVMLKKHLSKVTYVCNISGTLHVAQTLGQKVFNGEAK